MCAIFGLLDFRGKLNPAQRRAIFRELANAAQIRGTDASGIAYVQNGAITNSESPQARIQDALADCPGGPVSHGPYPYDHPRHGIQKSE